MTKENLMEAIEIISSSHSIELKINTPVNNFVGDLGKKDFTLHITKCPAIVIDNLLKKDFSCSMEHEGMSVNKWK